MTDQYNYPIGPPTLYEHILKEVLESGQTTFESAGVVVQVTYYD